MKNNSNYLWVLVGGLAFAFIYQGTQIEMKNSSQESDIFQIKNNTITTFQKDIVKKFREGNITGLSSYFGEEVSLSIFEESDFYTPEDAKNILLSFCQNNTVKRFFVKHFGNNQNNSSYYLIAELVTTNNDKYRVFIANSDTHIESIEITLPRNL